MKYIRTKDGIYDYDEIYENKHNHTLRSQGTKEECFDFVYMMKSGIAKADTIEELCDKCVVKLKYEEQPFIGSFYEFEHFITQYVKKIPSNNPVTDIYGAIWTDKGLIYVAKMNDKGELELL